MNDITLAAQQNKPASTPSACPECGAEPGCNIDCAVCVSAVAIRQTTIESATEELKSLRERIDAQEEAAWQRLRAAIGEGVEGAIESARAEKRQHIADIRTLTFVIAWLESR